MRPHSTMIITVSPRGTSRPGARTFTAGTARDEPPPTSRDALVIDRSIPGTTQGSTTMLERHPGQPDNPDSHGPGSTPSPLAVTGPAGTAEQTSTPVARGDAFLARARRTREHHGGHPPAGWPASDQTAVALLLGSRSTLQRLGLSLSEAYTRLADDLGLSAREVAIWVERHHQAL